MAEGQNSGGGWGWFWLIVIIALVGGGYLYQREGGKVFGPDGLIGPPKPASPPVLDGIKMKWDTGAFSHDLLLTNETGSELRDVALTITFYRDDGEKAPVKKFWSKWGKGETQKVNVPAHRYQKEVFQGTALRGFEKVKIDESWTTTWK